MIIAFYPGAGGNRYRRMIENLEWQQSNRSYDHLVKDQYFSNRYLFADSIIKNQEDAILTHCVNTPLISTIFPGKPITVITADLKACLRREWILAGHERYLANQQRAAEQNNLLELYDAVRDPSWPIIQDFEQINTLPLHIQRELSRFRDQCSDAQRTAADALAGMKKKYYDRIESAYTIIQWHLMYYAKYPLDLSHCQTVIDIDGKDRFAEIMTRELGAYSDQVFDECWAVLT